MDLQRKPRTAAVNAQYHTDVTLACAPLLVMSCFLYGLRPLALTAVAVLTGTAIDRGVAFFRGRVYDPHEHSSECFAALLAMLLPATTPYYVAVIAVICADLLGKEVFGGVGCYPFHPTAVGYAVAAICWPEIVFRYPQPFARLPLWGVSGVPTVAGASAVLKAGGLPSITTRNLLTGNYPSPMGTAFVLVILACGIFLALRRDIDWITPASFLAVSAVCSWVFLRLGGVPLSWPWENVALRIPVIKYEMLTGAMLYAAVFLISEPVTTPKGSWSRAAYGAGLAILTMLLRYFGSYETGVCFALLLMNSVSGWLDRAVRRLGSKGGVLA